ncbi:hypothetical protein ABZS66_40020, partial [Dactylosporangium sp. NPDC005572]
MTLRRTAEALALAAVQGFCTVALLGSWGGRYWVPDALAGGAVCVAALLRNDATRLRRQSLAVASGDA